MQIRLTVKLADVVDGIDLSRVSEGDVLDLAQREAEILIAEGWAERVASTEETIAVRNARPDKRAIAADGLQGRFNKASSTDEPSR